MTDHRTELEQGLAGRYTLERELGRGGMAVVYLAHDIRHDRPVALKVLHPDLAHALGADRFQREIHVAARLQHPHILTVHDSGETGGQCWFTMPFVEGESLRDRLARETQLPIESALRIAREAAQALQYAHDHGVVHRDIKPENLLLTADGNTLVADFGIARALGTPDGEHLTQTGTSIGTAAYMSPEQAAGEREVGPRSDIYSLAIVLYEMLAGETPFQAPTPQAMIARRFTEHAKPLRSVRDSVPEPIERAVQQALSRTAADRFPTARAFSDALALQNLTVPTVPTIPKRRISPALAMLVLGLVVGGGFLFAWNSRAGAARDRPAARAGGAATEAIRIAVLPFDNLGDSADAYFADGVTEAVRGKLAAVGGIEVIARQSSEDYRGTTKPASQVADELGVDYLLIGRVRWVRLPDGTSRVQVSPELVEIGDGSARTRWSEPFDTPLTDVFAMQGEIAGRVTGALHLALGASDRQQLDARPTTDLGAWDAYIQSEAIQAVDEASVRRAAALLEDAVARDSTFALAWARLASRRTLLWASTLKKPSSDALRQPLERAIALAPEAPETYRARIGFATNVQRDTAAASKIGREAVARYPSNADLVRNLAVIQFLSGETDGAIASLRRAAELDPRRAGVFRQLSAVLMLQGRQREARDMAQRALALAPGDLLVSHQVVLSWLAEGDLAGARRALNGERPADGRAELLAYTASYDDLYWVLDSAQQDTVLGLAADRFGGDASTRALAFAQIHHHRGNRGEARAWADIARREFEALRIADADDPQVPSLIGMAHSLAGRHDQALAWFERGVAAARANNRLLPYTLQLLARGQMMAGRNDAAIAPLEEWTRLSPLGPGIARVHPEFAPLRGNPRFEALSRR